MHSFNTIATRSLINTSICIEIIIKYQCTIHITFLTERELLITGSVATPHIAPMGQGYYLLT